jgi:transcriptional regulator with PAS, ATPase and Fis domain
MKSKDISYDQIKIHIDKGKSSTDTARSLGVSQSTVWRKAKQYGLQFKKQSTWRML